MRYYQRDDRIEAAECEETAARLEHAGWQRITPAQHRAAWRKRDMSDLQRIEVEDWLARQARFARATAPVDVSTRGPNLTNLVLPTKSKG